MATDVSSTPTELPVPLTAMATTNGTTANQLYVSVTEIDFELKYVFSIFFNEITRILQNPLKIHLLRLNKGDIRMRLNGGKGVFSRFG